MMTRILDGFLSHFSVEHSAGLHPDDCRNAASRLFIMLSLVWDERIPVSPWSRSFPSRNEKTVQKHLPFSQMGSPQSRSAFQTQIKSEGLVCVCDAAEMQRCCGLELLPSSGRIINVRLCNGCVHTWLLSVFLGGLHCECWKPVATLHCMLRTGAKRVFLLSDW